MTPCEHIEFAAHVSVSRIVPSLSEGEEGRRGLPGDDVVAFRATVEVKCEDCGAEFGFRCQDVGDLPDRPAVSTDALTLRVPLISPAELELLGPLAAMQRPDDVPGFTVRVRSTPPGGTRYLEPRPPAPLPQVTIVLNGARYLPETRLITALAALYRLDNAHKRTVAVLCDDFLDPDGRLLGLVRDAADVV